MKKINVYHAILTFVFVAAVVFASAEAESDVNFIMSKVVSLILLGFFIFLKRLLVKQGKI